MQEEKLSQTESRMLVKWIGKNLSLNIFDGFYFWRMSPEEAVQALKKDFAVKIEITDVLKAIKA